MQQGHRTQLCPFSFHGDYKLPSWLRVQNFQVGNLVKPFLALLGTCSQPWHIRTCSLQLHLPIQSLMANLISCMTVQLNFISYVKNVQHWQRYKNISA